MLSSVLAVHPRIEAVYEPWNRGDDESVAPDVALDVFLARFADSAAGKDVLFVKETATHLRYLDYMERFLRSTSAAIDTHLILLWRNPFHIFLSEIEARRKWWGEPNVAISAEEFDRWADPRIGGLGRMIELGREFKTVLVFYEALVGGKDHVVPALMDALALKIDPRQLEYEKYLDKEKVRGDVTVATDPGPVSDLSVRQRQEQLPGMMERVADAAWYARVTDASLAMSEIENRGVVRLDDPAAESAIKQLRAVFSPA